MPRHPPIALKTLDRSHCQCPSRNPGGIVARTRSCAEPGFNGIGTKRPASRDRSEGAARQPIICGRLSVSPRQTRAIDAQPAECRNNRGPHSSQGVRTNLLFTMSCRTCGGPKPAAKPDTNDAWPELSSQHLPPEEGWWSRTGSNRRPPACKAGALPAELRPLIPVERFGGPGRT